MLLRNLTISADKSTQFMSQLIPAYKKNTHQFLAL